MGMTYEQALEYINSASRFGSQIGLGRMNMLLARLGDPHKRLKYVHVAGTKGKGSATGMTAAVLTRAGYRTGCYVSPFVVDFRERIQIDGKMISREALAEKADRVRAAAEELCDEGLPPTVFELTTACAMLWYAESDCDIVVLEVGIGGRCDATNVISTPLAALIMVIDYDHTELLGNTIEKIAFEKCGIIKRGGTVVIYPCQRPEALEVIRSRCAEEGCRLVIPDAGAIADVEEGLRGSSFTYRKMPVETGMPGRHQIYNASVVLETLGVLAGKGFPVRREDISAGIASVREPARIEVMSESPLVIVDGAHNPVSIAALRDFILSHRLGRLTGVAGMMADKDYGDCMDMIAPYLGRLICTQADTPRALPAEKLAAAASRCCGSITVEPDWRRAAELALKEPGDGILVFGSLYLASDVHRMLGEKNRPGK